MSKELALFTESELSLVEGNLLSKNQLSFILTKTPEIYVHERPAKGGGKWKYVSGGYVKKALNAMFGWDWDFEIMEQIIMHDEAIVKGKLTCRVNGRVITKMQFGNKDIIYRKAKEGETDRMPLSIGNDLKSAATDALKKCASELGIAADIYNAEEFREIRVIDDLTVDGLKELVVAKFDKISPDLIVNIDRILDTKNENANPETKSFKKLFKELTGL